MFVFGYELVDGVRIKGLIFPGKEIGHAIVSYGGQGVQAVRLSGMEVVRCAGVGVLVFWLMVGKGFAQDGVEEWDRWGDTLSLEMEVAYRLWMKMQKCDLLLLKDSFPEAWLRAANTGQDVPYMTELEKLIVRELNLVRRYPRAYARFLVSWLECKRRELLSGNVHWSPTITRVYDQEGNLVRVDTIEWDSAAKAQEMGRAIGTLLEDLEDLSGASVLYPERCMDKACEWHMRTSLEEKGDVDHIDVEGGWPWDRVKRFCREERDVGEAVYGSELDMPVPPGYSREEVLLLLAREAVASLLLDEGIPGYGHRETLLTPGFNRVGVCALPKALPEDFHRRDTSVDVWVVIKLGKR